MSTEELVISEVIKPVDVKSLEEAVKESERKWVGFFTSTERDLRKRGGFWDSSIEVGLKGVDGARLRAWYNSRGLSVSLVKVDKLVYMYLTLSRYLAT